MINNQSNTVSRGSFITLAVSAESFEVVLLLLELVKEQKDTYLHYAKKNKRTSDLIDDQKQFLMLQDEQSKYHVHPVVPVYQLHRYMNSGFGLPTTSIHELDIFQSLLLCELHATAIKVTVS